MEKIRQRVLQALDIAIEMILSGSDDPDEYMYAMVGIIALADAPVEQLEAALQKFKDQYGKEDDDELEY